MRKTKIVSTLGPSSNTVEAIKRLINAGINVARINFSHGNHDSHGELIKKVIQAREEMDVPLAIMLDTKGPEIRTGMFNTENGAVEIKKGQNFTFTTNDVVGDETRTSITYCGLPNDVQVGGRILVDDGLLEFEIMNKTATDIECKALNNGKMGSRKGVNVPDVYLNLPSMTEQDIKDIEFGIKMGVDYIAASFVRSAKDVMEIRQILDESGSSDIHIIAKIESRDGVKNIDGILEVADGIMVARGDLGVEIPPEEVPLVQKHLIKRSGQAGKPVITATHMLESMITNPRPTRAEAADVANAIFDGTDAVMLSGETAMGGYPVEAVKMMARIAEHTESELDYKELLSSKKEYKISTTNAICYSTCATAADLNAAAIATVTETGFTARKVSRFRPHCPIVAVALSRKVWRQLSLVWGCAPIFYGQLVGEADVFRVASEQAEVAGFAKNGDSIIITAGLPVGIAGSTNFIKVQVVGHTLAQGDVRVGVEELVQGRAVVVEQPEAATIKLRTEEILVVPFVDERMIASIRRAKALIIATDKQIDATYAETVCDALQIPLIICGADVLTAIQDDVSITIDCKNGHIYNGDIDRK